MAVIDYTYSGMYDPGRFQAKFVETFSKHPRYNPHSMAGMLVLVDLVGRDANVSDVRWGAYMLATVMWETAILETVLVPAHNKKGKPLLDKRGHPVTLKRKKWLTMSPIDEADHGKGRRYHEPVKIFSNGDGSVRVTEQDGDQWTALRNGALKKLTQGAKHGTKPGAPSVQAYDDDPGIEHAYYGRGYVQLTWWDNYLSSSVAIGRGIDLLLDPEEVKKPQVAYAIMSYGMRTGSGFANSNKFSDFFSATKTDYENARKMVNTKDFDTYKPIASMATSFEQVLLASRT